MSRISLIASYTAVATLAIALPGLFPAGPAIADDRPTDRPPVTDIDVSTLTIDSDFTVFMRKGVPEDVRRAVFPSAKSPGRRGRASCSARSSPVAAVGGAMAEGISSVDVNVCPALSDQRSGKVGQAPAPRAN